MGENVILLDYGGVLGYDHLIENEVLLGSKMGITPDELNERTSEKSKIGRAFRENRVSELEFWRNVSLNDFLTESMAHDFTKMWMDTYSLNKDMMSYLQSLRKCSIKVGVLTNIDIARSRLLEGILDIERNLDYYYPSYKYGFSKDSIQLWRLIKDELSDIKRVVYVDDRTEHIQSAKDVGWIGVQYTTLSDLSNQIDTILSS